MLTADRQLGVSASNALLGIADVPPKEADVFLAVVVPVYRGAEFIKELCARLHTALGAITDDYQIILVDDGSPDDAWSRIASEAQNDRRVLGLQLSRNFGQHYAITAGLDRASADWIVVMDGDLQDLPEDIPLLYARANEGAFDVVIAARSVREEHVGRRLTSHLFNKTLKLLSGLDMSSSHGNFRIMSRKVHLAFLEVREHMRFYPAIMQWLGFRIGFQDTLRVARPSGKSSYDTAKLIRLAIQATVAYSERPLHISIVLGLSISFMAFVAAVVVLLRKLVWGTDVEGWASLFTGAFFLGGLQIFLLGIVGLYVGKGFQEAKKRPLYIISKAVQQTLPDH